MYYSMIYAHYLYIAPTCFDVLISPTLWSWHQNFFQTCSSKVRHNKCAYVLVPFIF